MRRIIRLTESDLSRIVRRVIKENNESEMMKCIAKAYNLGVLDVVKLLPCKNCEEDPSTENIEACMTAVTEVIEKKGYGMFEMAQMTLKAGKCLSGTKGDGGFGFPGIGGGSY
jgi:hypothetical protein